MAFGHQDLSSKINKLIDDEIAAGHTTEIAWIVNLMITTIKIPKSLKWQSDRHRDEAIYVLREGYRQHVGSIIRDRKRGEAAERTESVFPGFERLQTAYSIERPSEDGTMVEMLVPTQLITREEWKKKRDQLASMRDGLDKHIEEIDRFTGDKWPELMTG